MGLCNNIKNYETTPNGVILAVLETPYVPLNGQQPDYLPYEQDAQSIMFPNGQSDQMNNNSYVSAALKLCASSSAYYFQATSDSQISSGFQTLFNQYVGQYTHLTQNQ